MRKLLTLMLLGTTVTQADIVDANWWSNRTADSNFTEHWSEGPRLGNARDGFIEGIVSLPSNTTWEINLTIRADETYNNISDYTKVYINSVLVDTALNYPRDDLYPISHQITGDSFTYRFESHSVYSNHDAHQLIMPGTVTAIPEPSSVILLGFSGFCIVSWRKKFHR